jgi:hypothetical protein
VNSDLAISQEEREMQQQQLMKSYNSLLNINEKLNDSYSQVVSLQSKLKAAIKIVVVLAIILVLRTVGMICGYILYLKGVRLPRWVDILL